MKQVLFDRRAEEELSQSALYYEAQEQGLGLRFLSAVEVATKKAASNPHIFPATTKKQQMGSVRVSMIFPKKLTKSSSTKPFGKSPPAVATAAPSYS
jgi:hypothetical protein